jgi:hypothetical protein
MVQLLGMRRVSRQEAGSSATRDGRARGGARALGLRRAVPAMAAAFAALWLVPASASGALTTVALWHMNETSGTTMVDSADSHDGVLKNVQIGLPGKSGTAYGFNGTSSFVTVPSDPALDPGNANIRVQVSVNTTSLPTVGDFDIIRKGAKGTGPGYKMEIQKSGQASCGFGGTSGSTNLIAGPNVSDGRWHTLQCIKNSSAIKLVVDGSVFSKSIKIGSIASTSRVILGASPSSDFYNGLEDEAKILIG